MSLTELEAKLYRLSGMLFTDERHIQAWEAQRFSRFNGDYMRLWRAMAAQFIFMHSTKFISGIDHVYRTITQALDYSKPVSVLPPKLDLMRPVFLIRHGSLKFLNTNK